MSEDLVIITSPEAIQAQFNEAKAQIDELTLSCSNLIINSKDSLEIGKSLATQAGKIEKFIELKRTDITKPILEEKRKIDDYAKSIVAELSVSTKNLRTKIKDYELVLEKQRQEELRQIEEERRRMEAERRRLEEEQRKAEMERQKAIEEAKKNGQPEPLPIQQPIPQAPVTSVSALELSLREKELQKEKSKNIRMRWTYEIIDENQIPREFMTVNTSKISKVVSAGIREISGIRIYQEEELVLR